MDETCDAPTGPADDGSPIDARRLAEEFSRQRDRLWRMVRLRLDRRLVGRVDPDDILQEAYLDAAKRLGHYSPAASPSLFVWMRLVVGQTLLDVQRRHLGTSMRDAGRDVSIHGAAPGASSASIAGELAGQLTSPSQAAARIEMEGMLMAALDGMSPTDREIVALRHFEELDNGEVAEVLGLSVKAASIRYVRAIGRLRAILERSPEFERGGS